VHLAQCLDAGDRLALSCEGGDNAMDEVLLGEVQVAVGLERSVPGVDEV
jgi:hypothetical protein